MRCVMTGRDGFKYRNSECASLYWLAALDLLSFELLQYSHAKLKLSRITINQLEKSTHNIHHIN
jgi:hypothetical protein